MKQFFYIIFGGLLAIGAGITLSYGAGMAWQKLSLAKLFTPADDGTLISGMKRVIRYTANEEEGVLSAASLATPGSSNGKITATAYMVKNLSVSGTPIVRNPDKLLPIASLTKLVTAVVARKLIQPNERIKISSNIISTYGNTAGFKTGETFSAEDLMYPLLMVSSNDAAEALAQSYDRSKFIRAMNDFTQSIGAYRTYLTDPSGLSPKNVSTANDMALILDWIRKNDPTILSITQHKTKTVRNHTWVNPTHFLSWSNYLGGKNGYIPESERTAASLFAMGKNKNVYAIILLGSTSRDADSLKLLKQVTE